MTLFFAALSVGFVHTLVGPDHYLPFIVIGRARRWGLGFTSLLTFVCGLGHVLSSVVLGLIGLGLGRALKHVQGWEGIRGDWAGWALLILGFAYAAWGVWRALKGKGHSHLLGQSHGHGHESAQPHVHKHEHEHDQGELHSHVHAHVPDGDEEKGPKSWKSLTPWLLVIIFVLGPCEPLIPLFFASGLTSSWFDVIMVCLGYTVATLVGMHLMVTLFWFGLSKVNLGPLERWSHALAGAVIGLAGVGMVFLGL